MDILNFYNAKFLIVDDQQANIDVLHDFLEMQGYQNIETSTDPRKVEQLIYDYKPDIILLDLAMPYLHGFDILNLLKRIVPANTYLPVLILTADITVESKRKALKLGASDFLTKPFDLIELQARVNTHLEIKFKNEQINEYAAKLEKLIATKDKFFSIIAHDLRNPFVGIENFTKILLRIGNFDPDEMKNQLQTIHSTAHQGHELLENLLRWAKSQTDSIEINHDVFRLSEAVNNCLNLILTQANNKNIRLENEISGDILIESDQDMLETILRNLISNAIKFTPATGNVKVKAFQKNDMIEISVIDTGIGIGENDKQKLFRIDSKLQSREGTDNETGSGLGLILCKEFIDKLGGNIWVESEIDKGTTFKFTIPTNL
ncbi:MAG: hybrid sensor histidine kinase/response regulator [Paludibacter sp.]